MKTLNGYSNAAHIVFPEGVASIKEFLFDCEAYAESPLNEITIPSTVTSIDRQVFERCYSLETVTYLGTVAKWNAITLGNHWRDVSLFTGITINGVLHTFGENDKISE